MKPTASRRLLAFLLLGLALLANAAASPTRFAQAAQPQLAADARGRVWLVYGRGNDLFVARSTDAGATFAPPVHVGTLAKLALGLRRGPRLAAHGDTLTVTAQLQGQDLFAFRSTNRGDTWSPAVRINDVPTSAREGLHGLAAAPDGTVTAVWLDMRSGRMELYGANSADGGATWAANTLIYHSPDGKICECCHPSAAFDARGQLAVMWRNSLGGARDLWLTTRAPGAKDFSTTAKLGEGTWTLNACPMDGGAVFPATGGFASTWQRAGKVYFSTPGTAEISLGTGKQPVAAPLATGHLVVWQRDADLWSARLPGEVPPRLLLAQARFPSVVPLPGGTRIALACEQGPDVTVNVLDAALTLP